MFTRSSNDQTWHSESWRVQHLEQESYCSGGSSSKTLQWTVWLYLLQKEDGQILRGTHRTDTVRMIVEPTSTENKVVKQNLEWHTWHKLQILRVHLGSYWFWVEHLVVVGCSLQGQVGFYPSECRPSSLHSLSLTARPGRVLLRNGCYLEK